ncbi:MAG: VanZ family protein [Desulfosoma sp.]|uniref:VanZ family protein n=1 Tax=Desulfosoma sp. TaxID=2603217 RepID=UPI004049660B
MPVWPCCGVGFAFRCVHGAVPWPLEGGFFLPGILFALSDEWHQSWVPGRFCSVWDVVLDAIGLCAGMAAVTALSHWAPLWHPARRHEPDQDWTKASVTARSP